MHRATTWAAVTFACCLGCRAGVGGGAPLVGPTADGSKAMLAYFDGDWDCRGRVLVGVVTPFEMHVAVRPQLRGAALVLRYTPVDAGALASEPTGLALWAWHAADRRFVRVFVDDEGNAESNVTSSGWRGDTWTWAGDTTFEGKVLRFRHTFWKMGPDAFRASFETGDGAGPWKLFDQESCVRSR